jgi:hypothetical protein
MALEVKKRYPVPRRKTAHHKLPQQVYRREQRQQSIRRMTTTVLVLGLLSIAGGVGYTWYAGQQKTNSSEPLPAHSIQPVFKPHKVASNAPLGVATQTATTNAKPGDNASISVRTNPAAECSITVKYNNVLAQDSGLVPKVADEFGLASWAWTVAPSAPKGTWPVAVTCKNKKNSAVVIVNLVVS